MGDMFKRMWHLLLDCWDGISDFFGRLWQDFRETSRNFKYKMAIVGGYLSISVLTVLIFLPRGEPNEINAKVRLGRTEIIGGHYFRVINQSSSEWRDIVFTMNGTYKATLPSLGSEKENTLYFKEFNNNGVAPPEDIQVQSLRIECNEGVYEHRRESLADPWEDS